MRQSDAVHRIDLSRPTEPPSDSKISVSDQLTEPVGVHFVESDQRVLFGTGYAATATQLRRELPAAPDVVVVEHGDPDHYGAVPALRDAYDDLTVVAPLDDSERLSEAGIEVDDYLVDGDTVSGFEAVHIPGHTPGNMSFVHAARGLLVVGDSFVSADSEIAAPGEWSGAFAPLRAEYNSDFEQLCGSLGRLADFSFDTALLTHGADRVGDAEREVRALLSDVAERS